MAKSNEKKSFIMYVDYQSDFEQMTGDECKEIMMLIFNYERTGKIPEIKDRFIKLAFDRIKRDLERNDSAWLEKKMLLSEAGKRGADKRWNKNSNPITSDSHPITPYSHPMTPLASMAVNVNVNDNVNVNEFKADSLSENYFIDSHESNLIDEEEVYETKRELTFDEEAELAWNHSQIG